MTDLSQISPCLLGTGFLMSMVFTMMSDHKAEIIAEFESTLSPSQQAVYDEIKKERLKLYFRGLALGTLLGGLYLYFGPGAQYSPIMNSCVFTLIVMGTMTAFYKLSPKSKWMVEYLNNPTQTKAWNSIYKMYQNKYYWGFALGVIGYMLIGYTLANVPAVSNVLTGLPLVGDYLDEYF